MLLQDFYTTAFIAQYVSAFIVCSKNRNFFDIVSFALSKITSSPVFPIQIMSLVIILKLEHCFPPMQKELLLYVCKLQLICTTETASLRF